MQRERERERERKKHPDTNPHSMMLMSVKHMHGKMRQEDRGETWGTRGSCGVLAKARGQ